MSPVGKSCCKKRGYYRVKVWEYSCDGMGFWSPLRSSLAKQYWVMDVLTGAYTGKETGDATERKDSYTSFSVVEPWSLCQSTITWIRSFLAVLKGPASREIPDLKRWAGLVCLVSRAAAS